MARRIPNPDPESIGDIGTIGMLKISSSPDNGTPAHSDFDPPHPHPPTLEWYTAHPMALLPGQKQKLNLIAEGQGHCPHPPQ